MRRAAAQPMWRRAVAVGAQRAAPATGRGVSTINQAEIAKFERVAAEWWDTSGPFKPLHQAGFSPPPSSTDPYPSQMNAARVKFVLETLAGHNALVSQSAAHPLAGLKVADVGCGGGLLSEV